MQSKETARNLAHAHTSRLRTMRKSGPHATANITSGPHATANMKWSLYGMVMIILLALAACGAPTGPSAPAAPAEAEQVEPAPADTDATDGTAAESADAEDTGDSAPMELAGVRTFIISPEESEVAYIATEELFADALTKYGLDPGMSTVRGTTQAIEGQLTLNFDDLSSALGENRFTVDMTTLSTDQSIRDNWLRTDGPRFNQYPVAEFIASEIVGAPESYTRGEEVTFQLVGELTVREVTQPKTFEVTATLVNNTITGTATTDALLTEFDIEPPHFFNTLTVADPFSIEINFVAHAQE
jgi:polyisoprenoid-binding protein YceI